MKTYFIEVSETLSRVVEVQAEDSESAVKLVSDMYSKEEIVLDSSDFTDCGIICTGSKKNK